MKSKHLAGYIFALCIAMASISLSLAGFVVQSLSAALLYQLANTKDVRTSVIWSAVMARTTSVPYTNVCVGKYEGTNDVY